MQCNYIVRLEDNRLVCFYYTSGRSICYRMYENNKWQNENILVKTAQPDFTVNFSPLGGLHVFCQDESGSILLVNFDNDGISIKTILENQSDSVHTIVFHSMVNGSAMSLLYNIPADDKKYKLIRQNLDENGAWDKPHEIDVFNPLPGSVFEVQHINNAHALVFYRSEGNIAGYREVTPDRLGDFNSIQRYNENILSYSFLTDMDAIHTLYVTSNLFSSRLIYRKKEGDKFETPLILWEGQWLDNCLLMKEDGQVQVFFQSGGNLYMCKSSDNGGSFSRPEVYRYKFCRNPAKAYYITSQPLGSLDHTCRDVYVDSYNPWDVQILPDICEGFYPYTDYASPYAAASHEESVETTADSAHVDMLNERLNALMGENQNNKAEISRLKQSLNDAELKYSHQSIEKDDEINKFIRENKMLKELVASLELKISKMEAAKPPERHEPKTEKNEAEDEEVPKDIEAMPEDKQI